jgi:nifR3 family TIM-barrel protein
MQSFWHTLPQPLFIQAPMEDVTDAAFRRMIAKYGKPSVMFTEFTSADGLVRADATGVRKLRAKLLFDESERPVVAQLFSGMPEYMEAGARIVHELGFDGLDINMGCPVQEVVNQGSGAALIKDPALARELIRAAKRGMEGKPVSIKTRSGYTKDEIETWIPELLAEEPAAITIHARTRKDMSAVPARWELVARAVHIRDSMHSSTLIIGNGDLTDMSDARAKIEQTHCDGVMLGRALYGNPWLFADHAVAPTRDERLRALIEHINYFQAHLHGITNDAVMKKHFKAYVSGWDGAKELRVKLMEAESLDGARAIIERSI